jgi:predicted DNA-binding transcriptional regulator YafY
MTPGPRGRNATLCRVLALARRLDGLRYAPRLEVLADEFCVSVQTIRRDLYALEDAGWPVPQYVTRLRHEVRLRDDAGRFARVA